MNNLKNTWVIIPSYNESRVVRKTVEDVLLVCQNVVLVDDGSVDGTVSQVADLPIHIIRHPFNLGQGASIETGLKYALLIDSAQVFVMFDADGQMNPSQIQTLVQELNSHNLDVVLGSRSELMRTSRMPFLRKIVLRLGLLWTRFSTKLELTDTHNGFRALNRFSASKVHFNHHGMAHASEFLKIVAYNKWKYREVQVDICYTEYSMSKGQSSWNWINILWDLTFG